MGNTNWKKSESQEKLEADGYEFITNFDPRTPFDKNLFGRLMFVDEEGVKKHEEGVKKFYMEKGYKDVLITNAHDCDRNPLPEFRAIYVRQFQH